MTVEWVFNVWASLISFFSAAITMFLISVWKRRPKKYVLETTEGEWIDIEITPIPSDIKQKILITDGEVVEDLYYQLRTYNQDGKICVDRFYKSKAVTHWRPFPEPPSKYGGKSQNV